MEQHVAAQEPSALIVEQVVAKDDPKIRLWSDMQRFYVDAELLNDARQSRWTVRIPATRSAPPRWRGCAAWCSVAT